jgi:hypothetical protein
MRTIPIPQQNPEHPDRYWWGTTEVRCPCGGTIVWAEAGYAPGSRACRSCLALYAVRGAGQDRRLVPQAFDTHLGAVDDAPADTCDEDIYRVPADLYPHFYQQLAGGGGEVVAAK